MEELIDKKYGAGNAEDVKAFLDYTTNYRILEKINQVKDPINKMILENMENEVTDENDKVKCAESETVLTEAIKIYNKRHRSPKLEDKQIDRNSMRKTNKEYTDEEMKAVKEVLESYLKADKLIINKITIKKRKI